MSSRLPRQIAAGALPVPRTHHGEAPRTYTSSSSSRSALGQQRAQVGSETFERTHAPIPGGGRSRHPTRRRRVRIASGDRKRSQNEGKRGSGDGAGPGRWLRNAEDRHGQPVRRPKDHGTYERHRRETPSATRVADTPELHVISHGMLGVAQGPHAIRAGPARIHAARIMMVAQRRRAARMAPHNITRYHEPRSGRTAVDLGKTRAAIARAAGPGGRVCAWLPARVPLGRHRPGGAPSTGGARPRGGDGRVDAIVGTGPRRPAPQSARQAPIPRSRSAGR